VVGRLVALLPLASREGDQFTTGLLEIQHDPSGVPVHFRADLAGRVPIGDQLEQFPFVGRELRKLFQCSLFEPGPFAA